MKIIIFAGGTGKRFWPVSRKTSPKQFLPIVGDKPLVRLRYDILLKGFKKEDIFVSTGQQYKDEIKQIIPELDDDNLILEKEMRDTGPAVTLAVSYVHQKFPDEVISIQWSDHLIKDVDIFVQSLKFGEKTVIETNKIVFVTVPARFPSPHRGYINFAEEIDKVSDKTSLRKFVKFVEKPTKELAVKYIESKTYGWNTGYWIVKGEQFLDITKRSHPEYVEICREIVQSNFAPESVEKFSTLEKISADYAFAEFVKSDEALALLTEIGWSDVGEWIAFKEALEDSNDSNVTKGSTYDYMSKDTLVYNTEEGKLITTIGLDGMIVVNTPDIIAVFHKDDNTKIKEFLKKFEEDGFGEYL
jgi:mannose-1-phosphate guanylyltransferase